jgi:ATP-dependent Clp protease adaptor protein ClpS
MAANWTDAEGGVQLEQETRERIDRPRRWQVLLHNDNYTTMEFVVLVLMGVFHKPEGEAIRIMYDVHRKGVGRVGAYSYEVAETKVRRVAEMAQHAQFPLLATMEPE